MSLERDLKEAFERHADDARPAPAAWVRIERRITRRHRARAALSGVALAVLIAAAVVALPKLGRDTAGGFATENPSAEPSAPPKGGERSLVFRYEPDGWQAPIPADWWAVETAGRIELQSPGLPTFSSDPSSTFIVAIDVLQNRAFDDPTLGRPSASAQGYIVRDAEVAGFSAKRHEWTEDASRYAWYDVDWTLAHCPPNAPCPRPTTSTTLAIFIFGGTDALWNEWLPTAERLVEGLEATARGYPSGEVRTFYGGTEAGVTWDDFTATLVRFLDARVRGEGAEQYLTDTAKQQYTDPDSELGLYGRSSEPPEGWSGYVVQKREEADANSAEFTVHMLVEESGHGPAGDIETIGVGYGRSSEESNYTVVVRFGRWEGSAK